MTKMRSFLRSLLLFVRLLAAKAEKRVRPSSVLAVGVLAAVAAVACMNSPAGGDGNGMAGSKGGRGGGGGGPAPPAGRRWGSS